MSLAYVCIIMTMVCLCGVVVGLISETFYVD